MLTNKNSTAAYQSDMPVLSRLLKSSNVELLVLEWEIIQVLSEVLLLLTLNVG